MIERLLGIGVGAGLVGAGVYLAMRPAPTPAQVSITGFRWEDVEGGQKMPKPGDQVYMIPKVRNESTEPLSYDITVWLFRVFLGMWQTEPGCEWTRSFSLAGREEKECRMLVTLPTEMSKVTYNVGARVSYAGQELAMKSFGEVFPVTEVAGAASIIAFRWEGYTPIVMSQGKIGSGVFAPTRRTGIVLIPS